MTPKQEAAENLRIFLDKCINCGSSTAGPAEINASDDATAERGAATLADIGVEVKVTENPPGVRLGGPGGFAWD